MDHKYQRFAFIGLLWATLLLAVENAQAAQIGGRLAYIDPGAGSFLLQALLAAFAGIVVTMSVYWQKIKKLLGLGRNDASNSDSEDD
jgi:hypothetical protein